MKMYLYEAEGGFYKKTYKWHIAIVALIAAVVLFGSLYVGTSISSTRRYRAELERCAELERTVRQQEQAIRDSSEQLRLQSATIRQSSTELGELIRSSEQRISEGLATVRDLRETMQFLEDEYNNMRYRLVDINSSLDNCILYTEDAVNDN